MLIVRAFRASDQSAARALIEDDWGEHFGFIDRHANPDLIDIAASYGAPNGAFLVAEIDDEIVGTTGLLGVPRWHSIRHTASRLTARTKSMCASSAGFEPQ